MKRNNARSAKRPNTPPIAAPAETALLWCDDVDDGVEETVDDEVVLSAAAAAACVFVLDVVFEGTVVLAAVVITGAGVI